MIFGFQRCGGTLKIKSVGLTADTRHIFESEKLRP